MSASRAVRTAAVIAAFGLVATAAPPAPAAESAASGAAAPPVAGLARLFDPATAPFIPVPEIDTAPHSGLTVGVIPVVLRTNAQGEIREIIAPDVIYSQFFGWGSRARVFGYPSADTQWSLVGGLKQRVEREFDARYAGGQTRAGSTTWSIEGIYDRSGIPRFFGIGNESLRSSESTYVANQGLVEASIGDNLTRDVQLAYAARLRYFTVLPGVLHPMASIERRFPGLLGLGGEHELQHRVMLSYDSRDSPAIPHQGARYVLYGGVVSRAVGSSVAYTSVGADARRYWPVVGNLTVAWHGSLRYMPSARGAPFWALSSLGGDRSVLDEREPLRAYGDHRFVDRNLFASGLELRTAVASFDAFTTRVTIEVAPFVDVGKVFADVGESPFSRLHKSAGVGFRGVASPFVVGYVDIGYGHDKAAVFSGINYPF